jgi:hypothetical protein
VSFWKMKLRPKVKGTKPTGSRRKTRHSIDIYSSKA